MKKTKNSPWDYLWYSLYAFAGLGLELILLGFIEPVFFGETSEYTSLQRIIHWLMTVICWAAITILLVWNAKKNLHFDVLSKDKPRKQGAIISLIFIVICIFLNAYDWGSLKLIGEFRQNGLLLFIFQYVYYIFEIMLVFLIVVFGQKFAESLLKKRCNFPFGGILLCCTWGAVHAFTQRSFYTGLGVMTFSILYGLMHVCLNRNARYSYFAMLLAFIV